MADQLPDDHAEDGTDDRRAVRPARPMAFGCLANIAAVILGALIGTVMTVVAGVLLFLPSTDKVGTHEAPAAIAAPNGYAGYAAVVKRTTRLLGSEDLAVWIGWLDGGDVTRGHVVHLSSGWGSEADLRVEWLADGAVLRFTSGAEVRVPLRMFKDTR